MKLYACRKKLYNNNNQKLTQWLIWQRKTFYGNCLRHWHTTSAYDRHLLARVSRLAYKIHFCSKPILLRASQTRFTNKAIVDSRLHLQCRMLTNNQTLVVWRPTGTATWRTLLNITSCLILPTGPWYNDNITSSVKPDVHNVSQRHQRRTEPWPQATCTKMV